jgi:valyl-tRNA synthetase
MNLEGRNLVKNPALLPVDRRIYSRLNGAAKTMTGAFLSYRYNDAAQTAYEYFWNDFCDWYVEATKLSLRSGSDDEKDRATTVLLDVLAESLRLLHPLLPFVTEEIYGRLQEAQFPNIPADSAGNRELLITAPYPEYDEKRANPKGEADFTFLQELVRGVRTLRSECTITSDRKLRVLVRPAGEKAGILEANAELVKLLAGIGELELATGQNTGRPTGSIAVVGAGFEAFVFIAEAADLRALKQKFTKDIEKDRKFVEVLKSKLGNEKFLQNAPPELVQGEKEKLAEALKRTEKLESYIRDLGQP